MRNLIINLLLLLLGIIIGLSSFASYLHLGESKKTCHSQSRGESLLDDAEDIAFLHLSEKKVNVAHYQKHDFFLRVEDYRSLCEELKEMNVTLCVSGDKILSENKIRIADTEFYLLYVEEDGLKIRKVDTSLWESHNSTQQTSNTQP